MRIFRIASHSPARVARALAGVVALAAVTKAGAQTQAGVQLRDDPLARPLAVHLNAVTLDDALRAVEQGAAVRLSYSSDLLPPSVRVTMEREQTSVAEALRDMLRGTGLGMAVAGSGHIVILRATTGMSNGEPESGRDSASRRGSSTSPQLMDRVLVMGTPVAGAPERQLATAVSVVTSRSIREAQAGGMAEVLRFGVPGVVAWDLGVSGPIAQIGSVRGSTSFSANYLKTYLDGVELASPFMLFAIDPDIVDRIEVIRGPQGSALYGSDAISGVAHVVTHKGAIGGGWQPRVEGNASGGVVQTSFAAHSPTTHREFVGARGGGTLASYYVGVSLAESGSYVATASANQASATLAGRAIAGPVLLEGTARTLQATFTAPVSPVLARSLGTRAAPVIAREREGQLIREHTLGVTMIHEPSQRWRQTLVAGYDRNVGALAPQRNPASVADALLGASEEDAQRASLRYSSSLRGHPSEAVGSALTAGVELSWLERARSGPADLIGVPSTSTSRSAALYVDTVRNAGAFAQWKVDIANALFLVAGARGERNSSFGSGYGTAWAPMAGVSYVRQFEDVTVKFRSAYGRGIRPPPPSARKALSTTDYRQVANPTLAPETQSGVEGGFEIYAANRFSVSLTGFDQRAEGLIQHVVPDPRLAPRSVQQQNVGEISNRGIELQVAGRAGPFRADAMLSTVASRVEALSRYYTGDLRRGDRVPEVPSFSGAASIAAAGHGVRLELGAIFLGTWTGYDWLSYYAALASGSETLLRDYRTEYPGTVRPNIVLSHDVTARFSWFARVDNLTNRQRDGRDNLQVLAGRTTRLGVRWE